MSEKEIPVGHWAVFHEGLSFGYKFRTAVKKISRVTPTRIKFESEHYPRQAHRNTLIATFTDEAGAQKLAQSISGVQGEYDRRVLLAKREYQDRKDAAAEAGRLTIAKLVAALTGEPS